MVSYTQNKTAIFTWRAKHMDHFRRLQRKYAKQHWDKECYYNYEKFAKALRKICID